MPVWLAGLWGKLAAVGAIVAGVLVALGMARKAGKDAVRVELDEKALEIKDAQQKAAADAPRDRDALADRLRDGKF